MATTRGRGTKRSPRKTKPKSTEAALQGSIEPIYAAAGAAIAEARRSQDLTQENLSDVADMSQNQLARIERGMRRVSLAQLVRLAEALQVSPLDLIPVADPTGGVRLPSGLVESWQELGAADRKMLVALAERLARE